MTCDGRTGRGLDDLRAALDRAVAAAPSARDDGRPRLWIDRVFAVKGAGTVVTGTSAGGPIAVDDALVAGGHPVRVRAIEVGGTRTDRVGPGARVALNLAGVDHTDLARGDAVVRDGEWRAVDVVDGALTLLPGATLRRRSRLTAAIGSGEHHAWCRVLDGGFARLHLDRPVPLAPGDRVVLRDPGAGTTVAGLEVLDVAPVRRATDAPARLAQDPGDRVLADGWVPVAGLDARTGLTPEAARALLLAAGGEELGTWIVAGDDAVTGRSRLRALLGEPSRDRTDGPGVPIADAAHALGLEPAQVEALAASDPGLTVAQGRVRAGDDHGSASGSAAGRALLDAVGAAPFAPPPPDDIGLARALAARGRSWRWAGSTSRRRRWPRRASASWPRWRSGAP